MSNNYEYIDIDSTIDEGLIIRCAKEVFTDFAWRQGDSDMIGRYLSEYGSNHTKIKI